MNQSFLSVNKLSHEYLHLSFSGNVDANNSLILKGRYQQKHIETVLRRYISKYLYLPIVSVVLGVGEVNSNSCSNDNNITRDGYTCGPLEEVVPSCFPESIGWATLID